MALLRAKEVRAMGADEREKRLTELRGQLMNERGVAAMGGSPPSPGKIRQIRTAIARILTIQNQERSGGIQWAQGETPRAPSAKPAAKPTPKKAAEPHTSAQGRVNAERFKARHAAAKKAPKKAPKAPAAKKSHATKPKAAAHKAAPAAPKKPHKKEA